MNITSRFSTRSNRLVVTGVLLIAIVVGAACTSADPTEVTRIVEVPGPEVEVTRIVELAGAEVDVTRIVEVIAEPESSSIKTDDDSLPEATLSGTEVRILSSENTGRDYKISVALPDSYENDSNNYPVLYVLGANWNFGTITEYSRALAANDGLAETILVGIGYETDDLREIQQARQSDFFIEDSQFLQFLREELVPMINADYRVNPDDAALFGYSAGGPFVLYALFQEPHVFSGYMIASPWNLDDYYFDEEAAYAEENTDLAAKVYMGVGTEQDVPSLPVRQMAKALEGRDYDSLDLTMMVFEGETHASIYPVIANYGMKKIFE